MADKEDEKALWEMVTRGVQPLKSQKPVRVDKAAAKSKPVKQNIDNSVPYIAPPPIQIHKQEVEKGYLQAGDMSHVDGSIAQKLKDGEYPIEARLDLHGKTQDEAFELLRYFVSTSYSMEKRCMLIITGKGVQGQGVLREQFPKWLSHSGLREYILAYTQAIPQHGGDGAFYVLLRKHR